MICLTAECTAAKHTLKYYQLRQDFPEKLQLQLKKVYSNILFPLTYQSKCMLQCTYICPDGLFHILLLGLSPLVVLSRLLKLCVTQAIWKDSCEQTYLQAGQLSGLLLYCSAHTQSPSALSQQHLHAPIPSGALNTHHSVHIPS